MDAIVDLTNVKLETERVILRPWRSSDLEDFYEYAKEDDVGQMAGWNPHESIQKSEEILADFMEQKNVFAIEQKENHKVIGSLGLEKLSITLETPYDKLIGREIGYVLSKDYWGQGIMPESVKRVILYCFENEKYDFLLCCHSVSNSQSRRVIEKNGFEFLMEKDRTTRNGDMHRSRYYILRNCL